MREQIGRYKCNGLCSSLIAFLKYFLLLFTCKGSIERLIKKQQQNLEEIASQQQRRRRRKNFTSGVCTVLPVGIIIPVLGTVKEFYITWKDTNRRGQIPGWIANSQSYIITFLSSPLFFWIFLIFFQFMFFDCVFLLARITSLKIKYRHRIKKKKEE